MRYRFLVNGELLDFRDNVGRVFQGAAYHVDPFNNEKLISYDPEAQDFSFIAVVDYNIHPHETLLQRERGGPIPVYEFERATGTPGIADQLMSFEGEWFIYKTESTRGLATFASRYKMTAMRTDRNVLEPVRIPYPLTHERSYRGSSTYVPLDNPVVDEVYPGGIHQGDEDDEDDEDFIVPPPHGVYVKHGAEHIYGIYDPMLFNIDIEPLVGYSDDGWPIYSYQGNYYQVSVTSDPHLIPSIVYTQLSHYTSSSEEPSRGLHPLILLGSIITAAILLSKM